MVRSSLHDREILRLAIPALGALAAEPLYVLVDTAIVGHLGRPRRDSRRRRSGSRSRSASRCSSRASSPPSRSCTR